MKTYIVVLLGILALFIGALVMSSMYGMPAFIWVSLGESTYEMSLWFFIVAIIFLGLGVYFVLKIVRTFLGGVSGSVRWLKGNKDKRAQRRTHAGLIHFVEGDWGAAKKDLISAAKDSDQPLVHYLVAAKSAHELGRVEETAFLLEQAEKAAPENSLSIKLSQARMLMTDERYKESRSLLEAVVKKYEKHPVILDLLSQVYIQLNDWESLIAILPRLKTANVVNASELDVLEEKAILSFMDQLASDNRVNKNSLDELWSGLNKKLKQNSKVVGLYATFLHRFDRDDEAEGLVREALNRKWYDGLVELYGRLQPSDKKRQLKTAQLWLKQHPDNTHLLYALGMLSMRNELWGQARDYYESCLKLRAEPRIHAQLATLARQMGDVKKTNEHYKKGLELAVQLLQ